MNTDKGMNPAALAALFNSDWGNFLVASTEGAIEEQEAVGQANFVQSQSLPKECPQKELEAVGVIFGDDVDDLFVSVQLPDGWSIKPTDHSMWSDLLDEQGRKRGGIFYKAAFYDRSSHMNLDKRYSIRRNYDLEKGSLQFQVFDCAKPIFSTNIESTVEYSDKYWEIEGKLRKSALSHLTEKYPEHEDCNAYWL